MTVAPAITVRGSTIRRFAPNGIGADHQATDTEHAGVPDGPAPIQIIHSLQDANR